MAGIEESSSKSLAAGAPVNQRPWDDAKEYLLERLQQTIGHTQFTTKNLYLVNGALLAIMSFVAGTTLTEDQQLGIFGSGFVVLGLVNMHHARLLRSQGTWYYVIENIIGQLVRGDVTRCPRVWDIYERHMKCNAGSDKSERKRVRKDTGFKPQTWRYFAWADQMSNHQAYRALHTLLGVLALLVGVGFFCVLTVTLCYPEG